MSFTNRAALPESFLTSQYPETDLPPLWQVIYQEAIRGHHLMFNKSDIEAFDLSATDYDGWIEVDESGEIEEVATKLLACVELQEMIDIIDHLSPSARRTVYILYRRLITVLSHHIKSQLN